MAAQRWERVWWGHSAEGEAEDEVQKVMGRWGHLLGVSCFLTEKGRKRWRERFPNYIKLSSNKTI